MLNDRIEICSASSPGETGEAKKQSTSPLILAPAKLPIPVLAFLTLSIEISYLRVRAMGFSSSGDSYLITTSWLFTHTSGEKSWRASKETILCNDRRIFSKALSVFFDGALHWLRESGDIVAFHVEEERAYNMALPQGVTLRHVAGSYCSAWLGVAAGYTSLVDFDDEEIYVQVTTEKVEVEGCLPDLTHLTVKSECGRVEGDFVFLDLIPSAYPKIDFCTYHIGSVVRNLLMAVDAPGGFLVHSMWHEVSRLVPYHVLSFHVFLGDPCDDGPRYSLGIGPSSNDAVGFRRKFAEGIGKLAGNVKGDRREEDQKTCRKIAGGCWSMREADQRKSQVEIRKVEGTTFAKISTGKPLVSDG
ncbi:hypothetical protein GW17_00044110 [Ensete ventricosum]|nr:hypothetical protein GW17_00044110 [Ensete ventricosum]